MPSDRRSRSAGSNKSAHSRAASGSMGHDGGEVGRRMAAEEEYIRRELEETTSFCNAFWGPNDAGFEVVQQRMKTAGRTMEELKALYKERADIEAEYAKRLSKLAKSAIGRDETGSMRAALEVVRMEIDTTSRTHADLAVIMRKDLEGALTEFSGTWSGARRNSAMAIEKLWKTKQMQEGYVAKSREKYEQDCIKINGYTAQSSLVQGRDLDKVTAKLDKAQATVSSNDKDYQNFVRALKDTTHKWVGEWKTYLDQCQDLEEERLDFLKGNLWNFANSVSAVCVADDEACERVRVSLENCEAPRDILMFIQQRGTGSAIPDPPEYINYSKGQPPPARPAFHSANFQRSSTRPPPPPQQTAPPPAPMQQQQSQPTSPVDTRQAVMPPQQQMQDPRSRKSSSGGSQSGTQAPRPPPPSDGGMAAPVAAAPSSVLPPQQQQQQPPGSGYRPPPGAVQLPGMGPSSPAVPASASAPVPVAAAPPSATGVERRMSAGKFLARTSSMSQKGSSPAPAAPAKLAAEPAEDPIAKALANLRARPGGRSPGPASPAGAQGSSHRLSQQPPPQQAQNQPGAVFQSPYQQQQQRQQQQQQPPRAVSPSPSMQQQQARAPSPAFMQAPERAASPLPVDDVLSTYGQSFPGERRALSRQNSTASRISQIPPQQQQQPQHIERARSPGPQQEQGFAGVGTAGRSPSPQPFARQQQQQQQQARPQQQQGMSTPMHPPVRSSTPLGISLDATGSVTHDQMAEEYIKRSGSVGPGPAQRPAAQFAQAPVQHQQQHPQQQQQAPQQHLYQQPSHHQSQPSMASQYGGQQPAPNGAGGYAQPAHMGYQSTPSLAAASQQPSHAHQASYAGGAPPQQQASIGYAGGHAQDMGSLGRASAYGYAGVAPPPSTSPAPSALHYGQPSQAQQQQGYAQPPQQQQQQGYSQQAPHESNAAAYMHAYQQSQGAPPPQQQQQQAQPGYGAPPTQSWGAPPPAQVDARAPSPLHAPTTASQAQQAQAAAAPPTGQFSESGKPILFYVSALYDYTAASHEEFSFTAGDVIAVWETNPDGWWQGELLDETRRTRGSTFPSNFVSLLS